MTFPTEWKVIIQPGSKPPSRKKFSALRQLVVPPATRSIDARWPFGWSQKPKCWTLSVKGFEVTTSVELSGHRFSPPMVNWDSNKMLQDLVGGIPTPLKIRVRQLGWWFSIYVKIKHVPNHQAGKFGHFLASFLWFYLRFMAAGPLARNAVCFNQPPCPQVKVQRPSLKHVPVWDSNPPMDRTCHL